MYAAITFIGLLIIGGYAGLVALCGSILLVIDREETGANDVYFTIIHVAISVITLLAAAYPLREL